MKQWTCSLLIILLPFLAFATDYTTVGGTTTTGSSSVFCVTGSFTNTSNVNTTALSDFASFSLPIGAGCSYYLSSTLNGTGAAGSYAGFHVSSSNLLSLMGGITIKTYLGGTLRETASGASLQSSTVLGLGDIYFKSTMSYDAVRIEFAGLIGLGYSVSIFYGFALDLTPDGFALPVFIDSFTAELQNDHVRVAIQLNSISAIQNIILERSEDGKLYSPLYTTNSIPLDGSIVFDDNAPSNNTGFYRIKVETVTGKAFYSSVQSINNSKYKRVASISGNVSGGRLILYVRNIAPGNYLFKLYSTDSKLMMEQALSVRGSQSYFEISKHLTNGIYIIELEHEGNLVTIGRCIAK